MTKILEQLIEDTPLTFVNIQEYDILPAKDEHNDLGIEVVMFLFYYNINLAFFCKKIFKHKDTKKPQRTQRKISPSLPFSF